MREGPAGPDVELFEAAGLKWTSYKHLAELSTHPSRLGQSLAPDALIGESEKLARTALACPLILTKLSSRSYRHPLGYTKVVIWEGRRGERIRLHFWDDPSSVETEIHDHYWDFLSIILAGHLEFFEYEIDASGEAKTQYAMIPKGNGGYRTQISGEVRVRCTKHRLIAAGETYFAAADRLHSTSSLGSTRSLVLQGPRLPKSNIILRDRAVVGEALAPTYLTPQAVADCLHRHLSRA